MSPIWLKVILMLVMIAITLLAGLVPVRILKLLRRNATLNDSKHQSSSLTLCLLTCFSGGVFLATCFLDLLPDVNKHLHEIKQKLNIVSDYPFAELLSCLGFFLVFGLEEIVLKLLPGHGHSHKRGSNTPPHLHVHRSLDNIPSDKQNDVDAYQKNDLSDIRSHDGKVPLLLTSAGRHDDDREQTNGHLFVQDLSSPSADSAAAENDPILSHLETQRTQLLSRDSAKSPHNSNVHNGRVEAENGRIRAASKHALEMEQMLMTVNTDEDQMRKRSNSMVVGSLCSDDQCITGKYGSMASIGQKRIGSELNGSTIYRSMDTFTELHPMLKFAEPEICEKYNEYKDEDPPILMASQPHAHNHGIRSISFVLALSFHSVLEGLAFGVQKESTEIITLFISLIIHKAIVAFSVGLQLFRTHPHQMHWVVMSIFVLAMMTPLGAVIGMIVQESTFNDKVKDVLVLVFEGLAVGTFLYVTFFEVLQHERDNEHPNLLKLFVIMVSFSLIACFRLMKHGDHHENGYAGDSESFLQLNSTAMTTII